MSAPPSFGLFDPLGRSGDAGGDHLLPLALPQPAADRPVLMATHQTTKKQSSSANRSGLPWKSGMQCFTGAFESYRGRAVDIHSLYLGRSSWSGVIGNLGGSSVARSAALPGEVAIALSMLMQGQSFGDCNAGRLDGTFKDIGKKLKADNLAEAIVRLGWEANGTSYAWSIRSQGEAYKSCFKRLVGILRKEAPKIRIEWSMRKDNGASVGVHQLYPGNDVVDIIGTSFYDRYPSTNNQSQWDSAYRETKQGGPKGIGTWLDFAKSKGKKLALAEWAVSDGQPSSSRDNAFFVEKVWQFLKSNSSAIAYEAYFNCVNTGAGIYMIYPEKNNPQASAKYRQLWRSGT
ncbi:MAG TPA: glycosyl hydrolase [Geminicoccaceae bacterium]|nr:glycosyl hydrolase [Geminicoccus sp.]HMU48344.1 glycosyl hydrolase [Geminicoccaceae bacterium]